MGEREGSMEPVTTDLDQHGREEDEEEEGRCTPTPSVMSAVLEEEGEVEREEDRDSVTTIREGGHPACGRGADTTEEGFHKEEDTPNNNNSHDSDHTTPIEI